MLNLPKYKCHKIVGAVKIDAFSSSVEANGNWFILDAKDQRFDVPKEWSGKFILQFNHPPIVGGYLVQYEDGYLSWSPAEAFEAGYALIESAK